MSRTGLVLIGLMALVLDLFPEACIAGCPPSSCGDLQDIRYPFRLKGHSPKCGKYELACENNRTAFNLCSGNPYMEETSKLCFGKYYVEEIFYVNGTMRLVDANLDPDTCSLPPYSLTYDDFIDGIFSNNYYQNSENTFVVFMNCTKPVHNSSSYVDATPCINNNSSSSKTYFYAVVKDELVESDVPVTCTIQLIVPAQYFTFSSTDDNLSIFDIHRHLLEGFYLYFDIGYTYSFMERFHMYFLDPVRHILEIFLPYYLISTPTTNPGRAVSFIIKGRTSLGILCFIALLIYKFRQRHLSIDETIEKFLQSDNNLVPIRYSYSEIKGMTKNFKDKLGQGGFGSVYKGKSRSGHLVAVKVLDASKANGQDFINEVATIGRIYHVNVVRLTGYCVEGSKQALIYDFMANGSLDKFIFHGAENITPLSWEKMYKIGLGIARGIEYLHRGCNMQILHFDIRPHNILLDENFIPKVSDFGLAKLYPIDDSIVCLTKARGTLGYIAPELFYKNIGGISYKADVYSFGMLLMEMVGKRKNVNALAEHSSQIYFPSWVYDRINQDEDIELGDANEDEKKLARKLIIIALWCIQLKPMDRPSMSKVLEMLEDKVELLQMPPKPFLCPQEMSDVDDADNNPRRAPISSYNDIGTITLDAR